MSSVLNGTPPSLLSLDLAIIDYHKDHLTMDVMLHGMAGISHKIIFSIVLERRKDQNYSYEVHVI